MRSRPPTPDTRKDRADPTASRAMAVVEALKTQCGGAARDDRLGHEIELAKHHGVGRRTMRAAVRELERQGIVRVDRGRNGGLFVNAPPMDRAAQSLSDAITLMDLPTREVAATSMALYRIAAPRAAACRGNDRDTHLRQAQAFARAAEQGHRRIDDWCALRNALVRAAGSPVLAILQGGFQAAYRDALAAELRLGTLEAIRSYPLWELEQALVRSVAKADPAAATDAARAVTGLEARYLEISLSQGLVSATLLPETLYQPQPMQRAIGGKLAHQTLRALHVHIHAHRLESGAKLGSVAQLAARFGIGGEVMREALVLARQQDLIELRRGRGGGVFVLDRHAQAFTRIARKIALAATPREIRAVLAALEIERKGSVFSEVPARLLIAALAGTQAANRL